MKDAQIHISLELNASAAKVYSYWLDSKGHSEMTGGEAVIENKINGKFTAWDGYISGITKEKVNELYIKQTWRTSEFDVQQEDSVIEVNIFHLTPNSCRLELVQYNLPDNQVEKYKAGWIEHYFSPMKNCFG